ncbi:MAG: YqhA family protein, partial [Pseudomonadota bacterium]|nr:YqhA family protein [Pseudomonadota bacterium]
MNQLGPITAETQAHPPRVKRYPERKLEDALFAARWLIAPFYAGLILSIGLLMAAFVREIVVALPRAFSMGAEEAILVVLTLVDLSLAANLLFIVVYAGYENFVSKIDTAGHEDRPAW